MGEPAARNLVETALAEVPSEWWTSTNELRRLPGWQTVLKSDEAVRRSCLISIVTTDLGARESARELDAVSLATMLARSKLQLTFADVQRLFDERVPMNRFRQEEILVAVSRNVEAAFATFTAEERATLAPILTRVAPNLKGAAGARLLKLASADDAIPYQLLANDDFGRGVKRRLDASTERPRAVGAFVRALVSYPASGRPSKAWRATAEAALAGLEAPDKIIDAILDAGLRADDARSYGFVEPASEVFLCAAVACAGFGGDGARIAELRRLAVKCATIIGGQGGFPRSLRAANACAQAIADSGTDSSITELLALERSVRHGTLRKQIRRAIDSLAAAQGMTTAELLERSVERHELDPDGVGRVPLVAGTAIVTVTGRSVTTTYEDADGKPRKAIPAGVKEEDPDGATRVRDLVKAIRTTLAGERTRLDGLLGHARRWTVDEWRKLYLGHPITGRLSRALIWRLRTSDGHVVIGLPVDAHFMVTSSAAVIPIPDVATVELWHPIAASADEVRDWRRYLMEHQVVQPVKQAFREVYVVAPAELETRVYSNRFAGHIFRQVQARALMKSRGWQPVPLAWWDDGIDHGVARRAYDEFGIRAEFFFDPIDDMEPGTGDLYPYCTSDQVRFLRVDEDDALAVADVPALVFTEAMRDVDLFIGVTSIGADPDWLDRGEGRRFEMYWQTFSFGELTNAAEIRRDVVADLIPRLAIADRCSLDERYLRVRGDLREYRIHLGSGNILMAPDDEYLCIVAARSGLANKLFLPFDDDPVLSMILSKAFMLADDTKITDPTIVNQITRSPRLG